MSTPETFGPRLRRQRERRGITLETLAEVTKVSAELWEGLERNDFSRWPSGIFARAFIRDYAQALGLDADELVDEFCRCFPVGDRRTARLLEAQGRLIGHQVQLPEAERLPPGGDRRAVARLRQEQGRARMLAIPPRLLAVAVDTGSTLLLGAGVSFLLGTGFWASTGVLALIYYGATTITGGQTAGARLVEILRQRVPALFAAEGRAHAA